MEPVGIGRVYICPLANGSQNQRTCSDQPLFLINFVSFFKTKWEYLGLLRAV
jgi:hypothetical protein